MEEEQVNTDTLLIRIERLEERVRRLEAQLPNPRESERGYTHCSQCGGNYYRCGCR